MTRVDSEAEPASEQDEAAPRRAVARLAAARERIKSTRGGFLAYRFAITLLGVAIIAVGIVLLPLPGPGWLIIFGGLGVLATEYEWAQRLLRFAREQVGRWTAWVHGRSRPVQALLGLVFLMLAAAVAYVGWYVYLR